MGSIPTASTNLIVMQRTLAAVCGILLAAVASAQEAPGRTAPTSIGARGLIFEYADRATSVPQNGLFVEAMPVLRLIGAEVEFSPAAGTYRVTWGSHEIQFTTERRLTLVDGKLFEAPDAPRPSPGGIAVSLEFLDRALLGPLGLHLQPLSGGYRIAAGARFLDPVAIRPAAADFGGSTTVVLTLARMTEAVVEEDDEGDVVVRFPDASPMLDATVPFRSQRVRSVQRRGSDVVLELARDTGLLTWHALDSPPRVVLELGERRPTPTPAPVRIVERTGPPPIVIDPGHGGDDIGAGSGTGLVEKNLTLTIARRLATILERRGYPVRLTRSGDDSRALSDRTALANRLEARVFVSLHANASTAPSVRGAETYYMSLDRSASDAAAAATAEVENRVAQSNGSARSPIDLILWDLAQSDVLNQSARLALSVQQELNALLGLRDRGVKQAPFVVLTGATMPAVLVEVGFLSNTDEAALLASPDHQQRLAEAIARGIEAFLGGS